MEKIPNKDKELEKKSLSDLRTQIDQLEKDYTEAKRQERVLSAQRSTMQSLYKWRAPERPFNPKDKKWYLIVTGISLIFILLAVLTDALLLVVAILAILAVVFAMNTVPPPIFDYEITNKGLKAGDTLYLWRQIPRFWITQKSEDTFFHFEYQNGGVSRLIFLLGDGDVNIISTELIKYIDYLTPQEAKRDVFMLITEGRHKALEEIYKTSETAK